jgi:5-methylcytosine-specific restriction endonuclease McrA
MICRNRRLSSNMADLKLQVLRTDLAGMPLEWVDYRVAVRLYCLGQVAYCCGSLLARVRGGVNARSRRRSVVELNSIIATHGNSHALAKMRSGYVPPLSNRTLFQRDDSICMYCGNAFGPRQLSRDHVRPLSQGGENVWTNVVTACLRCNNHKAGRTPEAAGMQLLAVPFAPTHAEYIYLQGRHVLADQMEFLRAHFPRSSPLYRRLGVG